MFPNNFSPVTFKLKKTKDSNTHLSVVASPDDFSTSIQLELDFGWHIDEDFSISVDISEISGYLKKFSGKIIISKNKREIEFETEKKEYSVSFPLLEDKLIREIPEKRIFRVKGTDVLLTLDNPKDGLGSKHAKPQKSTLIIKSSEIDKMMYPIDASKKDYLSLYYDHTTKGYFSKCGHLEKSSTPKAKITHVSMSGTTIDITMSENVSNVKKMFDTGEKDEVSIHYTDYGDDMPSAVVFMQKKENGHILFSTGVLPKNDIIKSKKEEGKKEKKEKKSKKKDDDDDEDDEELVKDE